MDSLSLLRLPLALAVVIGLIFLVAALLRRYGPWTGEGFGRKKKRLSIVESQMIDGKRRLLLVRRDGVEHLLLIGGAQDLLVEAGIRPGLKGAASAATMADTAAKPAAPRPVAKKAPAPPVVKPEARGVLEDDDDLYSEEAFELPPLARREPSLKDPSLTRAKNSGSR